MQSLPRCYRVFASLFIMVVVALVWARGHVERHAFSIVLDNYGFGTVRGYKLRPFDTFGLVTHKLISLAIADRAA